jgi:hypothetical protein
MCQERNREMLKRQIENIQENRERADTRKYYQRVNRLKTEFQPHLNAFKDNNVQLIEGDDKILEHWVKYFKTKFEKENSDEENDNVFLTAEPLLKEPSQEQMEKAICNLLTNQAPGEDKRHNSGVY